MTNKVLEKILQLTKDGYEIRIKPDVFSGLEFRLIKDNHTIAHTITQDMIVQTRFWKTNDDLFLYILNELEYRYLEYVDKIKEK